MNPQFPLYIVSKGRADTRFTVKALEEMRVPFHIIVEAADYNAYSDVIDPKKILILDPQWQVDYDPFDGGPHNHSPEPKSVGPGAARNFAWAHSEAAGFDWHWVMDDNIRHFQRLNHNRKIPMGDGTGFAVMEDFCLRYKNVGMAGPQYAMFAPRKKKWPPFVLNTRIYSCNLIRNDIPYRWRGRYNEDTDLSVRMLKDGWCTVQFNAFLQIKIVTQQVKGGNTAEFYNKEGTLPKSQMIVDMHPDVAILKWRFHRTHHYIDYHQFKNKLIRNPDVKVGTGVNDYGMETKAKA
jgi:hypothetical protein